MKKALSKNPHVNAKKPVYLDSASTTQTPAVVLNAMNDYYKNYRANVHRGMYDASIKATEKYEEARASVAKFINAKTEEIIFTSGTTAALNQLAYSLSSRLSHRDNVVISRAEHHANLVPWQEMAKHYGFEIRYIELKNGELDLESADKVIDENTKIVSLPYVSNILGIINPVQKIITIARSKNPRVYTIIDAAQAAAHIAIDVKKINCDFLAFSGHKMYGPTGIGVLYGKTELLEEHMEPFMFGGEMVQSVSFEGATWNNTPWKFEAGTPNIAGAIGLGAAVQYITILGWKKIYAHEAKLTKKLLKELSKIKNVRIVGKKNTNSLGLVSFTIDEVHPHDIAEIMNQENVCVRAGFHCAEPLHHYLGLPQGTVRVSLGVHNTERDIAKLIQAIKKVKKIFGI